MIYNCNCGISDVQWSDTPKCDTKFKEYIENMPMPKTEYYYSIDAAKFICALLVVAVHCMPFGYSEAFLIPNQIVRNYIARIAVPFFFVSSGYFYLLLRL